MCVTATHERAKMFKRIAAKIKSFFTRKKTQIQVIKYTAPKQPNQLFEFLAFNILFVLVHILLFPEYSLLEAVGFALGISLVLHSNMRHYIRSAPQLMTG